MLIFDGDLSATAAATQRLLEGKPLRILALSTSISAPSAFLRALNRSYPATHSVLHVALPPELVNSTVLSASLLTRLGSSSDLLLLQPGPTGAEFMKCDMSAAEQLLHQVLGAMERPSALLLHPDPTMSPRAISPHPNLTLSVCADPGEALIRSPLPALSLVSHFWGIPSISIQPALSISMGNGDGPTGQGSWPQGGGSTSCSRRLEDDEAFLGRQAVRFLQQVKEGNKRYCTLQSMPECTLQSLPEFTLQCMPECTLHCTPKCTLQYTPELRRLRIGITTFIPFSSHSYAIHLWRVAPTHPIMSHSHLRCVVPTHPIMSHRTPSQTASPPHPYHPTAPPIPLLCVPPDLVPLHPPPHQCSAPLSPPHPARCGPSPPRGWYSIGMAVQRRSGNAPEIATLPPTTTLCQRSAHGAQPEGRCTIARVVCGTRSHVSRGVPAVPPPLFQYSRRFGRDLQFLRGRRCRRHRHSRRPAKRRCNAARREQATGCATCGRHALSHLIAMPLAHLITIRL